MLLNNYVNVKRQIEKESFYQLKKRVISNSKY